jgi:hypothetical protein
MALKFRKNNYYKIIITFLICLILGFLYLGNYNLTESLANNDISNNIITNNDTTNTSNTSNTTSTTSYDDMRNNKISDANKALAATGGNNGSVESNTQIQAFTLAQNLQDKNTF